MSKTSQLRGLAMAMTVGAVSRTLSLVVVAGLAVAASVRDPAPNALGRFGRNLVPGNPAANAGLVVLCSLPFLALIWFPDFFGQMTSSRIYGPTPGPLVTACGWLLLLGVPIILYLIQSV
jgi:hypothetical protein